MFLQPKKTKFKKTQKGRLKLLDFRANNLRFGTFGLKAESSGVVTARQLEAARRVITRKMKRKGKIWTCVFPNIPVTAKPIESRMGKGKGIVSHWVAKVRGGTLLFEICGITSHTAFEALRSGGKKLPVRTKIFD